MRYPINKEITTKKKHACGNSVWKVVKSGALIKIQCTKCKREMIFLPSKLDKIVKI